MTGRLGRHLWREHRWSLLGVAGGLAFCLGVVGFGRYFGVRGVERPITDLAYLSLQLFVLESGSIPGPAPWELEVARILAPLVTVFSAAVGLLGLFRAEADLLRARFRRGHTIICGLGRKGLQLVEDFARNGERIVAIDPDATVDAARRAREIGAVVLTGDAKSPGGLERAGLERAARLIAVAGDDGVNVEIAVRAFESIRRAGSGRKDRLWCHVHATDPDLCALLQEHGLFQDRSDMLEVRVFDTFENAARLALRAHPLERGIVGPDDTRRVHLVILGFGRMGQSLALHTAHVGHYANGSRPRITVVDIAAEIRQTAFLSRHPHFRQVCDLDVLNADVGGAAVIDLVREAAARTDEIATVAVCLDNDQLGLSCAMALHRALDDADAPILVRISEESGIVSLFETDAGASDWARRIHPFGLVSETCSRDVALGESLDALAKAIHEAYRRQRLGQKSRPATSRSADDPALQPWDRLEEALRRSNRCAADHLPVKLRAIGAVIEPANATPAPAATFTLSAQEVALLAKMEHARWVAERRLAGWADGPRDALKKTSPFLGPWELLDDATREYDRAHAREIPHLLELATKRAVRGGAVLAGASETP